MNEDTGASRIRDRTPLRRTALAAALAGTALLAAACGGSNGSGSPTSAAGSAGSGSQYQQMVAYSQCMQSHGAPAFPDPVRAPGGSYADEFSDQSQGKLTGPAYNAALNACKKVRPKGRGITPAQRQAALDVLLKYAHCMRAHGLPDFPDPTTNGGSGIQWGNPYDTSSQQFKSAQQACRAYAPPGAP